MNGYLRVANAMPRIKVGNVDYNLNQIKNLISILNNENVKVINFPELSLTSCNLKNIFYDKNVLNRVMKAIIDLKHYSNNFDILLNLSIPLIYKNSLLLANILIKQGNILAIIPNKTKNTYFKNLNNVNDICKVYDYIDDIYLDVKINDKFVLEYQNNQNILFSFSSGDNYSSFNFSNVLFNSSSINETVYTEKNIKNICEISAVNKSCIVLSSPSFMESSTDKVYFGKCFVYECDEMISINDSIDIEYQISDIDLDKIEAMNKEFVLDGVQIESLYFNDLYKYDNKLYRRFNKCPYIVMKHNPYKYSMHILDIASVALLKRMEALNINDLVLGYSGGLDSTLALLICIKTLKLKNLSNDCLHVYAMPSYGTSVITKNNAYNIINSLNLNIEEIDIKEAMEVHFRDINHDINNTNVTFENAQARERTQILMDIANDLNGIVVGTSDLSEIALGFSTYNGDQMSMYNVNGPIPKTLIRYILSSIADENISSNINVNLGNALKGILDTPISPELLPSNNMMSDIYQKTEDIIGSYELHDFFLYNYLKYHYNFDKIYDLSLNAFIYNNNEDINNYSEEYIKETLNQFFTRLYKSQFKRNASPDSYDIGLPNISNAHFNAPSDLEIWLNK